jgi:hypothetical protein
MSPHTLMKIARVLLALNLIGIGYCLMMIGIGYYLTAMALNR